MDQFKTPALVMVLNDRLEVVSTTEEEVSTRRDDGMIVGKRRLGLKLATTLQSLIEARDAGARLVVLIREGQGFFDIDETNGGEELDAWQDENCRAAAFFAKEGEHDLQLRVSEGLFVGCVRSGAEINLTFSISVVDVYEVDADGEMHDFFDMGDDAGLSLVLRDGRLVFEPNAEMTKLLGPFRDLTTIEFRKGWGELLLKRDKRQLQLLLLPADLARKESEARLRSPWAA